MMTEGRDGGVPMRIAGLSRANKKDIERCYDAVRHAELNRIHTFLASSDIHLEHKLGISRAECLKLSAEMVTFAKSLCEDIEFSPEDAGRSDPAFLVELCGAVIEAGATTINLPDTVGYTLPDEYANMFAYCIDKTPNARDVVWSTHCHNDLGLATANSLAAVQSGARQVEVTLNSLGERAGNTSLEEVVMALKTRPQHYPVYTTVEATQIMRTSRMVAKYTGIAVQANKAIVGKNAFAHESGIHQHGVLKHANTYEIMTPESVGQDAHGTIVLGKHSGKAAYKSRLIELGYADVAADEAALVKLVEGAKAVADQKKTISDEDLEALLGETLYHAHEDTWVLQSLNVQTDSKDSGNKVTATATVKLLDVLKGEESMEAAIGVGPVDATFKAITRISGAAVVLNHYNISKIHGGDSNAPGNDALASVVLHITERATEPAGPGAAEAVDDMGVALSSINDHMPTKRKPGGKTVYSGNGTSTDIVVASAKAYLDALNRMVDAQKKNAVRTSS